jgi:hypothetical protein
VQASARDVGDFGRRKRRPLIAAFSLEPTDVQRGLLEASPLDAGFLLVVLSLLLDFGELELGFEEVPAGLLFMSLDPGLLLEALPRPLTVTRSRTRRFPAKELAMRFAVCFSLPVATLPLNSMDVSVTFTLMVSLRSVGSFCSAVWIWLCSVELSVLEAPIEDVVEGLVPAAPALAPTAPAPLAD